MKTLYVYIVVLRYSSINAEYLQWEQNTPTDQNTES